MPTLQAITDDIQSRATISALVPIVRANRIMSYAAARAPLPARRDQHTQAIRA